ncbi:hypothetical protein HYH03_004347 [Edaphochlamys debaryana]|uniref:YrhK domain-containing protein n=1 Tax=Edaphochlamys debaryana TaxID=47281 RepID=A0A835YA82_9CHLO|nr:hypothetical protein HYH03_004347 [Edaphochlamys debaryana]|eukprot:KAG2497603.1 hypothetical protein HYH03_004347 [Edaphochlamys debaryana]
MGLLRSHDAGHERHDPEHLESLLGEYHDVHKGFHPESRAWKLLHALAFVLGGTTFISGTVALFFPGYDTLSALLYTIGSCGFLSVDVQEFLTFEGAVLRANIAMSLVGSSLYVVGSVGFFPSVFAWSPLIGIWGFILGSAVIGISQAIKTYRIGATNTDGAFSLRHLITDTDARTSAGVETGACLGAWCFFFGTCLFNRGPLEGPDSVMQTVLWTWVAGSCFFTLGSAFLCYRHFVMRVV